MASCEKCWADANREAFLLGGDGVDAYRRLVRERTCSPEEQAGQDAGFCSRCSRWAVHQHVRICMACDGTAGRVTTNPSAVKT